MRIKQELSQNEIPFPFAIPRLIPRGEGDNFETVSGPIGGGFMRASYFRP